MSREIIDSFKKYIVDEAKKGASIRNIAKKNSISQAYIINILKENNITIPKQTETNKLEERNRNILLDYNNANMDIMELKSKYKLSPSTIRRIIDGKSQLNNIQKETHTIKEAQKIIENIPLHACPHTRSIEISPEMNSDVINLIGFIADKENHLIELYKPKGLKINLAKVLEPYYLAYFIVTGAERIFPVYKLKNKEENANVKTPYK